MKTFPQIDSLRTDHFSHYLRLVRADRPIGIYLLLWPTLWALWLAGEGHPVWWIVLIFILGTVLMRSAGCAVNDYADRHFDGKVERTRQRPLATGAILPGEALGVFIVLCLLSFGLVLLLDWRTILLAFVAVALAAIYPFTKRYTHLPQLVLGAAFAWAIPMAFSALQSDLSILAWILFIAAMIWTVMYDTLYAMVDREDDLKIGIKSTAILFGAYDRLIIGLLQLAVLGLLWLIGDMAMRGVIYQSGLLIGAALFAYQQYLIRERKRDACFKAFLSNNLFGFIVFIALFFDFLAYPAATGA